jgi:hypothetical protein
VRLNLTAFAIRLTSTTLSIERSPQKSRSAPIFHAMSGKSKQMRKIL